MKKLSIEKQRALFLKTLKNSNMPKDLQAKMLPLVDLLERFGPNPGYAGFQRGAKFIVKTWGLGVASRMQCWAEALGRCLDIECKVGWEKVPLPKFEGVIADTDQNRKA